MMPSEVVTPTRFVQEVMRIYKRIFLRALPLELISSIKLWFMIGEPGSILDTNRKISFDLQNSPEPSLLLFVWVFTAFAALLLIGFFALAEYEEQNESIIEALRRFGPIFLKALLFILVIFVLLLLTTVVATVFGAVGGSVLSMTILIGAAIFFGVTVWYFPAVMVSENPGPVELLVRLFRLSSTQRFRSLGYWATSIVLGFGITLFVGLLNYPLTQLTGYEHITEITTIIALGFLLPLQMAAAVVFYYDLRTQLEGPIDYPADTDDPMPSNRIEAGT